MNLYDIASKIMKEYDPSKDLVNNFEEIEDGTYTCLIEKVTFKENSKGTQWISFDCSIINDRRHMFPPFYFTEKTAERSIKAVNKLCYDLEVNLPLEAYVDLQTLANELNGSLAGLQCDVEKKTGKNGFTNYKITKSAEAVFIPIANEEELPW